jgi:TetR/AcrR family transcriptional repressor of nem operon
MGHSRAQKAESHQRIVRIAARRFRQHGLDGLSIADLMEEAGLTHGGFYKHFESRADLVIEALESAFAETMPGCGKVRKPSFESIVDGYLSETHRDSPDNGCAIGALTSDIGRAGDGMKSLYTAKVKRNLQTLAAALSGSESADARSKAIVAFSAMAGAIGLARAVSDDRMSAKILKTVRRFLLAELRISLERSKRTA